MPHRVFGRFNRYSSAQFERKSGDRGPRIVAKGTESDQRSEERKWLTMSPHAECLVRLSCP